MIPLAISVAILDEQHDLHALSLTTPPASLPQFAQQWTVASSRLFINLLFGPQGRNIPQKI
jgi:hypothetical protein